MFIFIVLFLLSSLLISIVICKDNKYCVNILFAGYLAAILVLFFTMVLGTGCLGLWDMRPIKVQIMEYESDKRFDEQSKMFLEDIEPDEEDEIDKAILSKLDFVRHTSSEA